MKVKQTDQGEPAELLPGPAPDRAHHAPARTGLAALQPAGNFVSPRGAKRGEKGKTHDERIGEIGIIHGESEPDDHQAADRIDGAEKHAILRRAPEILHALCDAVHDVGDLDLADFDRLPPSGFAAGSLACGGPGCQSRRPFASLPLVAASCGATPDRITFDAEQSTASIASSTDRWRVAGAALPRAHRRLAAKTIAVRPTLCHERASPTISRLGMRCLSL